MGVAIVDETHSITEDNERGIATGWLPGRLSAEGRRLARMLGERRRGERFVFISDYGEWSGAPVAAIEAERRRRIDEPFPGGQSYRDVVEQMRGFLGDLRRDHDGGRVLLIGHSATRWALQFLLEDTPLEQLVAPFVWQEGWEFRA